MLWLQPQCHFLRKSLLLVLDRIGKARLYTGPTAFGL